MAAQGLTGSLGLDPGGVVGRAVALQGQDLPAVLQAIAVRSGAEVDEVRAAFDRGELVRSWPMRGTLFATTPDWLERLLALTGERTVKEMARRRQQLGIDDEVLERSADVARERLSDGPVSRSEILSLWEQSGVPTKGGPGYHLIVFHAVQRLWHWGPFVDGDQCLVATPPQPPVEDVDVALAEVTAGYVRARGPVTSDDVAWWLKLPKGQVRRALAQCDGIAEVAVEGEDATYLIDERQLEALEGLPRSDGEVLLLPAFDEYYLGYQRRHLVATESMQQAVVPGSNGVFRPLIVLDGQVVGTWKKGRGGGEVTHLVDGLTAGQRKEVERQVATAG